MSDEEEWYQDVAVAWSPYEAGRAKAVGRSGEMTPGARKGKPTNRKLCRRRTLIPNRAGDNTLDSFTELLPSLTAAGASGESARTSPLYRGARLPRSGQGERA